MDAARFTMSSLPIQNLALARAIMQLVARRASLKLFPSLDLGALKANIQRKFNYPVAGRTFVLSQALDTLHVPSEKYLHSWRRSSASGANFSQC